MLLPSTGLSTPSSGKAWVNWAGNITVTPEFFTAAQTLREVADVVNNARAVRAVGGGLSCSPGVSSRDTMVDISALKYLLAIDYERQQVVAGAGMTIRSLAKKLAPLGYMLANHPESLDATLGGCIANAAHGTGMKVGTLSDQGTLAGLQLILANGTVRDLSADNTDDAEVLSAARAGLGGLGVISQVTLNVQPLQKMVYHARKVDRSEALNPAMWTDNDHYDLAWIPHTETYLAVTRNTTTENTPRRDPITNWWEDSVFDYRRLRTLVPTKGDPPQKPSTP